MENNKFKPLIINNSFKEEWTKLSNKNRSTD